MRFRPIDFVSISAVILVVFATELQTAKSGPQSPGAIIRDACGSDLQNFCPGLRKQEAKECLKQHLGELSAKCITAIEQLRAQRKANAGTPAPPDAPSPPSGTPPQ